MKKFFIEKWFVIAVTAIAIALVVNTIVSVSNSYIIEKNAILEKQVEFVKNRTERIMSDIMHQLDLGMRGYALTKDQQLLIPLAEVGRNNTLIFSELEDVLKKQNYPDLPRFYALKLGVESYIKFTKEMVRLVEEDNIAEFAAKLKRDKGYDVWTKYAEFSTSLFAYENELNNKATASYNSAMRSSLIFQIAIIVFSLPVLYVVVIKIKKERKGRENLLSAISENDKKYVFNFGKGTHQDASAIINDSIKNTREASRFVKHMANSNYEVEWEGLNESNIDLNKETLAGDLLNMREKLKKVKQEDEKRNWMNEGLASFSELVRNHQHDSQLLADKCVSFLTRYLDAQQASLFVVSGEEEEQYLQLISAYAFDKKKWIEKRIEIGNGIVGQAFLEGETIQLKQVPSGYTEITSGLGEATPGYLVIVPLKYDIQTVAIAELASFQNFQPHHILFLQKAGEFLAAAVLNSQNTQKMRSLLDHAKINEEQMRQREEEMRQNMEELQATQEELVRKEKEMQKRLSENKDGVAGNF